MSYDDENPASEATPVQPKTLRPYRHKMRKSASKISRAMSGVENLSQADQVAAFEFVIGELRKMTGGAVKALELAKGRDYDAYKALKAQVKAGIPLDQAGSNVDGETLSEFQILMKQMLGEGGEYKFDATDVDPTGQQVAEFQENKVADGGQDTESDQPGF
jgi:hypothetical protein